MKCDFGFHRGQHIAFSSAKMVYFKRHGFTVFDGCSRTVTHVIQTHIETDSEND